MFEMARVCGFNARVLPGLVTSSPTNIDVKDRRTQLLRAVFSARNPRSGEGHWLLTQFLENIRSVLFMSTLDSV
jgi:hypothetical protein